MELHSGPAGLLAGDSTTPISSRQSATQPRFDRGGYTGGTSGSPWVTNLNARTGTGTHGHTSASRPDPGQLKNPYIREASIESFDPEHKLWDYELVQDGTVVLSVGDYHDLQVAAYPPEHTDP